MSNLPMIDRDGLLERVDGDLDLMREIVGMFEHECPQLIHQMRNAVERADSESLRKAAHTFKGAVGNFSQDGAYTTAIRIETLAKAGNHSDAAAAIDTLEQEAGHLIAALKRL